MEAAHEEQAHKEIRPGTDYIKVNVAKIFRLHPLPHSLQRQQMAKLLGEWEWLAKPLQPARGSAEGGAWEVGSATLPPNNVMTAFNQDVLISLIRDRKNPEKSPSVVGPIRVQRHLRRDPPAAPAASSHQDPWQTNPETDPWNSWKGPKVVSHPSELHRLLTRFIPQSKTK